MIRRDLYHKFGFSTDVEIENRHINSRLLYYTAKRVFDISAVIGFAPIAIMLVGVSALFIQRDGGSAFFCQPRVGKGGRIFKLWKLRSMAPDAQTKLQVYLAANPSAKAEWAENQKLRNDPRITKVGKFIRKYSVDELPQLWNVLVGDMSLVGPRPILPEQRQYYPGAAYFQMRPGLTGLWQISARNGCTFIERAMYDTRYSSIMCFTADLKILFQTPMVVLKGTGL